MHCPDIAINGVSLQCSCIPDTDNPRNAQLLGVSLKVQLQDVTEAGNSC